MAYLIILFRDYNMLWTRRPKWSLASESLIMSHHYLLSYTGSPSVSVLFLRSYCTPFKALHGATPTSLTELISPYVPRRALRSADQLLLEQPTHKLKLIGLRAFSVCAPYLWNSFPFLIKSSASVSIFKAKLTTFFLTSIFLDFQFFFFFFGFLGLSHFWFFSILRIFYIF